MTFPDFNEDLIETDEAAQILGVLPRAVRVMVRDGLLLTAPVVRKPVHLLRFRRADVLLLADIRKQGTSYGQVVAMAQHASVTARRLETLVQRLLVLIGADLPVLDHTPEGALEVYRKAERALTALTYETDDVVTWSRAFLGMGPEGLEAAGTAARTEEPWLVFTDLAHRIVMYCADHRKTRSLEDTALMQYLSMSARELRKSAFLCIQRRYGHAHAVFLFPETLADVHHDLSALGIALYQNRTPTPGSSAH